MLARHDDQRRRCELGGVAARYVPDRRLDALASQTDIPSQEIHRRIWESGFDAQAELGEFNAVEKIAHLLELLDRHIDEPTLIGSWAKAFKPDAGVVNALNCVTASKVLFTNNGPMIDACLAGPLAALREAFDDVVCSWHLGARKPTADAFSRCVTTLAVPPEQLLLLDDDPVNIAAARRCGWNAANTRCAGQVQDALVQFGLTICG